MKIFSNQKAAFSMPDSDSFEPTLSRSQHVSDNQNKVVAFYMNDHSTISNTFLFNRFYCSKQRLSVKDTLIESERIGSKESGNPRYFRFTMPASLILLNRFFLEANMFLITRTKLIRNMINK